jgi:protein-tyrosine phosphatase
MRPMLVRLGLWEPLMKQISPNVYVGSDEDYDKLKDDKSWAFVRCAKYGPGGHQQTLGYHTLAAPEGKNKFVARKGNLLALNLLDLDDPNFVPEEAIQQGLDFIRDHVDSQKVLIACNAGVSRGPTMGLMWLRTIGRMPYGFMQSERQYRNLYRDYDPSLGIEQFARSHWSSLVTGKV